MTAETPPDRSVLFTPVALCRHLAAWGLLWASRHFMDQWYQYQHSRDSYAFLGLWAIAVALAAGSRGGRLVLQLSRTRTLVAIVLLFFSIPWGEWFVLNDHVHDAWFRRLLDQTLWCYGLFLFLRYVPAVSEFLTRVYRSLALACHASRWPLLALPLLHFAGTAYTGISTFQEIPLISDSASYLFQARIFATGNCAAPIPPSPQFFSYMGDNLVMTNHHWFTMYQPGYPLLLSLFLLFRAEWFLSPLLGAATALLWILYVRKWYPPGVTCLFAILMVLSPFHWVMSSALMAHPLELFLATAVLMLCRLEVEEKPVAWRSLLIGLCMLVGMLVRGFSLLAFLWPVLLYSGWKSLKRHSLLLPVFCIVGVVLGGALLAFYQWKTAGDVTAVGYRFEYDVPVRYGFGPNVLGQVHTFRRAMENTANNLQGMSHFLDGFPSGSLVFLFAFLLVGGKLKVWDRVHWAAAVSLALFYFFIIFQDFVYGPRYWYLMAPLLLLTIAGLADLKGRDPVRKMVLAAVLASVCLSPKGFLEAIRQFDPSRFQAASLKQEILRSGDRRRLVFLDARISQQFVNWNDPFLRKPVILVRDLGKEHNAEIIRQFPGYEVLYFRSVVVSQAKLSMQSAFLFSREPDTSPSALFSMFDLATVLQNGINYPDRDCFDLVYAELFTVRAEEELEHLQQLDAQSASFTGIRRELSSGLHHAARMLLLPKLALERDQSHWPESFDYSAFREELRLSRSHLRAAGDVGLTLEEQLDKVERRIDVDVNGSLSDSEIRRFLERKLQSITMRRRRMEEGA